MTMSDWAKREIEIACKNKNPNWDGKEFDYGCACYQSALKAYESLCSDGHSGYSFELTKNILIRLMNGLPLTPITEEDFDEDKVEIHESPEYLKENNLKSHIQCPRMSSLFRTETLTGEVSYTDVDRAYGIDLTTGYSYGGGGVNGIVDELFPITMPYIPKVNKYKVYTETHLHNKALGDFDLRRYAYVITSEGEKIEINKCYQEKLTGWRRYSDSKNIFPDTEWVEISLDEYNELVNKPQIETKYNGENYRLIQCEELDNEGGFKQ